MTHLNVLSLDKETNIYILFCCTSKQFLLIKKFNKYEDLNTTSYSNNKKITSFFNIVCNLKKKELNASAQTLFLLKIIICKQYNLINICNDQAIY